MAGGCVQNAPTPEPAPTVQSTPQPPQGGGGGVTPMSPGVGGLSPVTGAESVQGGGSAVGSVAKDRARQAAAGAGAPAGMGQMGGLEGGE